MKNLLSRYGGHGVLFGKGKASESELPTDQSFENIIKNHSIQMNGFSYLSSFKMMPEFMGAFQKLPIGAVKIAEINHIFTDLLLQYNIETTSKVYFGSTGFANIFTCYLNTDYKPLSNYIGKIDPTYDLVVILRVIGKSNEEINEMIAQILHCILGILIFEMEISNTNPDITPSKTKFGKKINLIKLNELLNKIESIDNREELYNFISL